jgi:hypothetical protein
MWAINVLPFFAADVERPRAAPTSGKARRRGAQHKEKKPMKYMLMMNTPSGGPFQIAKWPAADIAAHIAFMKQFAQRLSAAGELVGAEGLAGPDQARLVRAGKDGRPVTDGVFPEAKEFLAGYWIVDVPGPERAYEIAAAASLAPGPGGAPLYLSLEVRQVMAGPPEPGAA